jgi:thioesterase domain-containing protein
MVARYRAAIQAVSPRGPYFLAGSSMGGVLAYELARSLVADGHEVALLAMLDSPDPEGIAPGFGEIDFAAAALSYLVGEERPGFADGLASVRGEDERLAFVLAAAKACGSLPPTYTVADLARLAAVVEANRQALQPYRPEPYEGRLLHVRARETADRLARPEQSGWSPLCAGGVEVAILDGGHMSILFPPHATTLAARLEQAWTAPVGAVVSRTES